MIALLILAAMFCAILILGSMSMEKQLEHRPQDSVWILQ